MADINHTLTAADHATRVRIDSLTTNQINVIVGNTAESWPTGCYIEVVNISSTAPVSLVAFSGVTLNALSGTAAIKYGEYARVSYVSATVWDMHVYPLPSTGGSYTVGNLIDVDKFAINELAVRDVYIDDVGMGTNNIKIGPAAGATLVLGGSNVIVGATAGDELTSGWRNVFVGTAAGCEVANGSDNIMIGYQAGKQQALETGGQLSNRLVINSQLTRDPALAIPPYINGSMSTDDSYLNIAGRISVLSNNGSTAFKFSPVTGELSVNTELQYDFPTDVTIAAARPTGNGSQSGGSVYLTAANALPSGSGGEALIRSGSNGTLFDSAAQVLLTRPPGDDQASDVYVTAGDAASSNRGGNVSIEAGSTTGLGGRAGDVELRAGLNPDVSPFAGGDVRVVLNGGQNEFTFKSTGALAINGYTGAAGQVLMSSGVSSIPIWSNPNSSNVEFIQAEANTIGTTVQDKLRQHLYVEDFGAVGDGVTDDSAAIQAAMNSGRVVAMVAGKRYAAFGLFAVAGSGLVCYGGRATIVVPPGANRIGIIVRKPNFIIDGINFEGGNLGPYNVAGTGFGTRAGVVIGFIFGTSTEPLYNIRYMNSEVSGFDVSGFQGGEVQLGFVFGERVTLHNINAHHNYINIWAATRFEYITASQCYGYEGYAGLILSGGNNSWVACHFENNFENLQMTGGENNSHGQFEACSFNHCAPGGLALNAVNVEFGQSFTGCAFWWGGIRLENCTGVSIRNSQIAGPDPTVLVIGGGLNSIDDNFTPNGLIKTFIGPVYTTFRGNRTTINETSPTTFYPDTYAQAVAATFAYPIAWNGTTDATVPLVYSVRKWQGEDAAFLSGPDSTFYCPHTGFYTVDARVRFDASATLQGVMKVEHLNAANTVKISDESVSVYALAGSQENALRINTTFFMQRGELIRLTMRTNTGTMNILAGGINVKITSRN